MKRVVLCFLILIYSYYLKAEVLGQWNLNTVTTSPTFTSLNVTNASISLSSGTIQYLASPSSIFATSWSQSATFSATGKYWQFSIQAIVGKEMLLSTVAFSAGRTGAGPAAIHVQYSLNNFITAGVDAGTFVNANESSLSNFVLTNLPTSATTSSITFRIWGYNASSSGNFRLNNVIINGEVSTLPISLITFTARPIDKTILLQWKTASEANNKYFELQRSADGKLFTKMTTVNCAGNSDTEKSYSYTDENPFAGTNYYKLVQYDMDGKSTSKLISVDAKLETAQIFVSATSSSVELNISSPNSAKANVNIYDVGGIKISEKALQLNKGSNNVNMETSLSSGIYFVNLVTEQGMVNKKFAK